jgi:hypothetical protein
LELLGAKVYFPNRCTSRTSYNTQTTNIIIKVKISKIDNGDEERELKKDKRATEKVSVTG